MIFYIEPNELYEFWRNYKFQKSVQESFVSSQSLRLFLSFLQMILVRVKLICLLVWSRIIKLWRKKTSALNFASVQISNISTVQCWAWFTMINELYHDGTGINKFFDENFHFLKHFGQSWPLTMASPWGGHHSKSLKLDKLTRGLSFQVSGLPFPFNEPRV